MAAVRHQAQAGPAKRIGPYGWSSSRYAPVSSAAAAIPARGARRRSNSVSAAPAASAYAQPAGSVAWFSPAAWVPPKHTTSSGNAGTTISQRRVMAPTLGRRRPAGVGAAAQPPYADLRTGKPVGGGRPASGGAVGSDHDRDDREHAPAHQELRPAARGRPRGPDRRPRRGVPDRLAGRGPRLLPVPVRSGEPAGPGPVPWAARPRGGPGPRPGRPRRPRRRPVPGVLTGHEAAAGRGRRPAGRAGPAGAGRADQWAGPGRHGGHASAAGRRRRRRSDRPAVQPPAGRGAGD